MNNEIEKGRRGSAKYDTKAVYNLKKIYGCSEICMVAQFWSSLKKQQKSVDYVD